MENSNNTLISCTVETVTPEMAALLLESNSNNRPINQRQVDFLTEEIREGRWKLNGESIKLNGTRLLDGQHRLTAIMKSGKATECLIVRGIEADAFATIDLTRRRSGGDVLSIAGEQYAIQLASTLQVIHAYRTRQFNRCYRLPATLMQDELKLFPGCRESVIQVHQKGNLLPTSVAAACHYLTSLVSQQEADSFFNDLISGVGLKVGDPVLLLRNRLIENKRSKARLVKTYITAITIKSINQRLAGNSIKCLRWTNEEGFPDIIGMEPEKVMLAAHMRWFADRK